MPSRREWTVLRNEFITDLRRKWKGALGKSSVNLGVWGRGVWAAVRDARAFGFVLIDPSINNDNQN